MAQGLTFENKAGLEMQQAVALGIRAKESTFYKCGFRGYQDTLFVAAGTQFFRDCQIFGTIDFIFGNSKAVFQNCVIAARKPRHGQYIVLTAQNRRHQNENTGIVLQSCVITATEELRKERHVYKYFLGRPWGMFARVVIIQSKIDCAIDPRGWKPWDDKKKRIGKPYFGEYKNRGRGANTEGRVKWSRVMTSSREASYFTVRNFIHGETWIPSTVPYNPDLFSSVKPN